MMPLYYNRTAVVDGTASVHHRLAFMMRRFMHGRTAMDGAAFVYGRSVMSGTAVVHHRLSLMLGRFMYGRTVVGRTALVHHGLRLVLRCVPVHTGALLFGNAPVNCRTLMSGIASVHSRPGLVAAAFLYRADLLRLRGSLSAGMTGRRGFGNSHYERGAEKTGHQCNCQDFL